ncbi:MAG: S4 domain-containing protein, partial [Gammaproteobacteria bacterium]|nr:S4 domain-containing protein [Gammaproteobacteria bacterium]
CEIVDRFHGSGQGPQAQQAFIARFQKGAMPDEIEEITLSSDNGSALIANIMKDAGLVASTSEAMRAIKQGGVRIDGEKISDSKLSISAGNEFVLQVGKRRFAKILLQ